MGKEWPCKAPKLLRPSLVPGKLAPNDRPEPQARGPAACPRPLWAERLGGNGGGGMGREGSLSSGGGSARLGLGGSVGRALGREGCYGVLFMGTSLEFKSSREGVGPP